MRRKLVTGLVICMVAVAGPLGLAAAAQDGADQPLLQECPVLQGPGSCTFVATGGQGFYVAASDEWAVYQADFGTDEVLVASDESDGVAGGPGVGLLPAGHRYRVVVDDEGTAVAGAVDPAGATG